MAEPATQLTVHVYSLVLPLFLLQTNLRPFHTCPLLIWIQSSFNPTSKSKPDLIYFISSVNTTETRLDPDSI